jgi:hypothetical protein
MLPIRQIAVPLVLALSATAAAQQYVSDDFNRPNSTNLGPNWFEVNGDFVIDANQARGNIAFANDTWMVHTGFSKPYTQAKVRCDFSRFPGDQFFAAGLVFGADTNTWGGVAILVQDNNLDGFFDRIFFNGAVNAGAWFSQPTPVFYDFPQQIAAGNLTVWAEDNGNRAVARVEDNNGNLVGTYSAAGIVGSPFAPTGFRTGVWVRSRARVDNYQVIEHRQLDAYPPSLSVAAGGTQTLDISLGSANAGFNYLVLASLATAAPGTPIGGGVLLPLAIDPVLIWTASNPNTAPYTNTLGALDAVGHARARFVLPPAALPSLVGITLHHCAIAIKPTNVPATATNTASLTFTP